MINILKEKWEEIINTIKISYDMGDLPFKTWILPLQPYSIDDYTVTIFVPDPRVVNHIKNNYTNHFITTISNFFDHSYDVRFISTPDLANPQPVVKEPVESLNSLIIKAGLNPKYTFETFVVGDNNNFAHAASLAVAESPGDTYNPLFLYGGVGLGKTHLMQAIGNYIIKQNPSLKVMYVTSEIFTNELIESIKTEKNTSNKNFREKYRNVDVLLIDDIQFLFGKEKSSEMFFHIFNEIINNNHQIVITSDKMPDELQGIEERLISRFKSGLSFGIDPPEFETAKAILEKKIENLGNTDLVITDDVLDFMVMNYCNDIRSLEGQLKRLFFCSIMESTNYIDMNFASEVFKDQKTIKKAQEPLTKEFILKTTAEFYYLTISQIISKNRTRNLVTPREICMYLMRELLDITFSEIGTTFSNRDHSTVMKACKRVETKIKKDPDYKLAVDKLKQKLGTM